MAVGQWELVTRSKKDKNLTKAEKKKLIDNAPKVEDILPMAQVQSLYSSLNNKENSKPKDSQPKNKATDATQKKKPVQKQQPKAKKPEKPKPVSLDSALANLDIQELKSIWDLGKQRFPQTPVVWLKDLAICVNSRTNNIEPVDPIFYSKSLSYPTSALTKPILQYFEESLSEMGIKTLQNFYETCLSSIPFNLARGDSVVGYKLFIQLILKHHPVIVLNSKSSFIELKKSYQNNPQIGLSLLWCISQAMFKDFDIALRVFQELMFDMIEMKHYSKYIIGCLKTLLSRKWEPGALAFDSYIYLFDLVHNITKLNIPPNIRKPLEQCDKNLDSLIFDNRTTGGYDTLFETVMSNFELKKYANNPANQLLEVLRQCFLRDIKCIEVWKEMYPDHVGTSAKLLTLINQKWGPKVVRKINQKQFKTLLLNFNSFNNSVSMKNNNNKAQYKDLPIQEVSKVNKILIDKMTTKTSFPWKRSIFLLIVLIGALIYYDSVTHGSFEKSATKRFLKDTGAWEQGQIGLKHAIGYSRIGIKWVQDNGPVYYTKVHATLVPYAKICKDFALIALNGFSRLGEYLTEKRPVVEKFIESYAPGLIAKVGEVGQQAIELIIKWHKAAVEYLATQVFVGQLSPENLHKATLNAINTTQNIATRYYDWFNQIITSIEQN